MALKTCNDAYSELVENELVYRGNFTDIAILRFADSARMTGWTKEFTLPFNSKNKWMATVCMNIDKGKILLIVKGAPDILTTKISNVRNFDGNVVAFDQARLDQLQESWSLDGHRTLAVCCKYLKVDKVSNQLTEQFIADQCHSLTLIAMIAIRDPPRQGIAQHIRGMRDAGIRVFMVTGDFQTTAEAIARQVGIITVSSVMAKDLKIEDYRHHTSKKNSEKKPAMDGDIKAVVVNGEDIKTFTDHHWDVIISEFEEIVFSRTTPEQKMEIVDNLKARGDSVIGVTGDGTNDAPALKGSILFNMI
jgi:sodium/potassium-transporting ATPase subunit alpha